ncbi:MAG: hypothetical protein K0Q79_2031 [Flavipsychrobacter sp.]|nr:hypothetical protein [Flavipsychrobacter sp.]
MADLLLSGGGYPSDNWLPLISPLVALVIILYSGDFIIKFIKKRRTIRHHSTTYLGQPDIFNNIDL